MRFKLNTPYTMRPLKVLTLFCLCWAALSISSCNFTPEQKQQMVKSKNGKDFFRDSEKWGKVVTQTLPLSGFTHIVMDGNADINLRQGEEFRVDVTGNERAIEANHIQVEPSKAEGEGTLHVSTDEADLNRLPSIKIDIIMPDLRSATINGEGDFDIKGDAFFFGDLAISINGDGDVEANQVTCEALRIVINGDGDVRAKKFDTTTAHIEMNGDGDISTDLKASADIDLQLSGDGEAELDVKCQNFNVSAGGNGEIKLKGKCQNLTKQTFGKASLDTRRLHVNGNISIK